jgi:phosphomannomutase
MLSVSGCRGVVGETLTPDSISRFAGTFGSFLRDRAGGVPCTVVLGRDGRAGGRMVRDAAVAGLAAAGCHVVDLGVAMTPTVAIATDAYTRGKRERGLVAGMVITASHNPQQWNGLKCLWADTTEPAFAHGFGSAACAPPPELAADIIARFKERTPHAVAWDNIGGVSEDQDAAGAHVERLMEALQASGVADMPSRLGDGLRVALDSINASGCEAGLLALESLGCEEVLHINGEQTGRFAHPPEPTRENLELPGGLCDAVRGSGCDVGFAQDPDADRLAVVDETGRYIGEEYTLALSALALLEARKRAIEGGAATDRSAGRLVFATNLSTSRMLDDVAARYGAVVLRTPVGEAHVVAAMKSAAAAGDTVICGGEGNGGTIWPRTTYVRDSLSAMALILWLISERGLRPGKRTPLSQVVASLPRYSIEKRKVDLARREDAQPMLDRVVKQLAGNRIDTRDGVWVDVTQGTLAGKAWLHVRASNTEPILRLIAEAPTPEEARGLLDLVGG